MTDERRPGSPAAPGPQGGSGGGRSLSRHQFDEVMRRASELASRDLGDEGSGIDEAEVYRIAREVGLDEQHVRTALREVRSSVPARDLEEPAVTFFDRIYGPSTMRTSRVVEGRPADLSIRIDEFMVAGRLLQRVRRGPVVLQYRPAVDWMSQIARTASGTASRYYLASAKSVEIRLHEVDDTHTQVEFVVDPGIQSDYATSGVLGSVFGGLAAGGGVVAAMAPIFPQAMAVGAGVAAIGGVTIGVTRMTRHYHRKKYAEVLAEVEGVLDQLEVGEVLRPPPSSWRKWVERQFHGARKLLDLDGDGEPDEPF